MIHIMAFLLVVGGKVHVLNETRQVEWPCRAIQHGGGSVYALIDKRPGLQIGQVNCQEVLHPSVGFTPIAGQFVYSGGIEPYARANKPLKFRECYAGSCLKDGKEKR